MPKNGNIEAAEEILSKMETMYQNGKKRMKPNKYIFSSIITAYGNNGDSAKAEKLLQKMEHMANNIAPWEEDKKKDFQPDVVCFTGVIHAYASCRTTPPHTKAKKS